MKVLLSGGGTAGHITPLLAVADELIELSPNSELIFMGQKGDRNVDLIRDNDVIRKVYTVRAGKFRRFHSLSLWQNITNIRVNLLNLRDMVLVAIGFFQSVYKLLIIRPDVIFFKGGFVVVPIGWAARFLRIPYITHDSDPLPGLANRLIAKGAKKNAVQSSSVTAYPASKTVVTGVPLTKEYRLRRGHDQAKYKELLGFPSNSLLVFVFTGTQGAKKVDDALEQVLPAVLTDYPDVQVAYVFGRLNEKAMDSRFAGTKPDIKSRIKPMTFIDNAYDYIAASDIVIGRAGATTMAEVATIGRSAIIVPAEQLTGGHQLMNAEIYAMDGASLIVKEDQLPDGLENALRVLIASPELRKSMQDKIMAIAPDNAAKNIALEIVAIAKKGSK